MNTPASRSERVRATGDRLCFDLVAYAMTGVGISISSSFSSNMKETPGS